MSNAKTIKKAVLPVAGLGTRFLPATKAIPKEMLPIVDTPLVEFAVREAIEAGIEEIIFVTSHTKRSIEDHFDRNLELESKLSSSNKESYIDKVNLNEYEGIKFSFVRQREQRGLGDAISQVSHLILPDEYFAILLADDLFDGNPGVTSQLVDAFKLHGKSIIAVNEVSEEETKKYGVISGELSGNLARVEEIVEKPVKKDWTSSAKTEAKRAAKPLRLNEIETAPQYRWKTGNNELDRVLGGGLVPGSLTLLGGEPGIGKSTLLLQISLSFPYKVLYVSGEESQQQIKMRAERIDPNSTNCYILTETKTQNIFRQIEEVSPEVVIIDSIQTLHSDYIESAPGLSLIHI